MMIALDRKIYRVRAALFITLALTALILAFVNLSVKLNLWTATQWLFNYDLGFVKRGLIGTIIDKTLGSVTQFELFIIQFITALLVSVLLILTIYRTLAKVLVVDTEDKLKSSFFIALLLGSFFISAPGLLSQFFFNPGRFDVLGVLLISLAFIGVRRSRSATGFAIVVGVSALSIVLHEGFFLWVTPISLGMWVWTHGVRFRTLMPVFFASVALAALTYAVAISAYDDYLGFGEARKILQSGADFQVSGASVYVHYRSFSDNFVYTASEAWNLERMYALAVGGAFLVSLIALVARIGVSFGHRILSLRSLVIWVALFSPLAFFALGHDHGRWLAMINCNLVFLVLLWVDENPNLASRLEWWLVPPLVIATMLQVGLGPFGDIIIFPDSAYMALLEKLELI